MRRISGLNIFFTLTLTLLGVSMANAVAGVLGNETQNIEYQIKAAYLYNFMQFVSFPPQSLQPDGEVVICIVGENRFGDAIDQLNGASSSQGRLRVEFVKPFANDRGYANCNVIYIVGKARTVSNQVLSNVDVSKVLTIGEYRSFVKNGGGIELYVEDDLVHFRINVEQAKNANFQIAAQLVELGARQ